jgi:hypothetical protein
MEWSHFQTLGGDKYQFKRVVAAELATKDLTNIYDYTARYTGTDPETYEKIMPGA